MRAVARRAGSNGTRQSTEGDYRATGMTPLNLMFTFLQTSDARTGQPGGELMQSILAGPVIPAR